MSTSTSHRERPHSTNDHPRGHHGQEVDAKAIRARSFKIRNAWSNEERVQRAYTAQIVQRLLLGPPVGFRLEAE